MNQYRRNIMVGITVLVALFLLGWMMIRFSDAPFKLFAKPQMPITLVALSSEGLSDGSPVYYKGVSVGRVLSIERSPDQRSVLINCEVDQKPPLPANLAARIRTTIFGGTSSISLYLVEHSATRPSNATIEVGGTQETEPTPVGQLMPNQHIAARFVGVDLLPKEFTNLANDLTLTSQEIRRFSQEFRESHLLDRVRQNLDTLHASLESARKTFDSADRLINDQKMRKNLDDSLANFHEASVSAAQVGKNLEKLSANANTRLDEFADNGNKVLVTTRQEIEKRSQQLGDRIEQLATVLHNVDQVTQKINQGKGTAGALVNDPALYETLLDTSRELNKAIKDLRRLIDQWEQEGVPLKLN